jgi:hypothetical protein
MAIFNTYGQEKNAVFIIFETSTGPINMFPNFGVGYERKINDSFSYLFTVDIAGKYELGAPYSELTFDIDFLGHFRWYFLNKSLNGPFVDVGTGITLFFLTRNKTITSVLFPIQSIIGWKIGKKNIFIEPYVGYNITFGNIYNPKYTYPIYYYENKTNEVFKNGSPFIGLRFGLIF